MNNIFEESGGKKLKFLKHDQIYVRIILELAEKECLSREGIARIVEPEFPYVPRPERYRVVLNEADRYARILERKGFARKASYRGRGYTLQITDEGKRQSFVLREK